MEPKMIVTVGLLVALSVLTTFVAGKNVRPTTRKTYDYKLDSGIDTVDTYLGIPYAKAPLGNRRFKDPVEADAAAADGANQMSPLCVQLLSLYKSDDERMSEDCLRLNIYSPYKEGGSSTYPVMVYIHGGSFLFGSGNWQDGHVLALNGVVVVTINYRLGLLGFMSDGNRNSALPGDYGIYDQVEALKWIKEHIGEFRGDPSKVTIFGNEVGGWSVSLHLMMEQSKGLFHRAIIQSGPVEGADSYKSGDEAHAFFEDTTKSFDCQGSLQQKLTCLRNQDAGDITQRIPLSDLDYLSLWKGSRVLPDDPARALRRGHVNSVPVMVGMTAAEAARDVCMSAANISVDGTFNGNEKDLKNTIDTFFQWTMFLKLSETQLGKIMEKYFPGNIKDDGKAVTDRIVQVWSDIQIAVPSIRLAKLLNRRNINPYFYVFANTLKNEDSNFADICEWVSDYSYQDIELPYVFGTPISGEKSVTVWHNNTYTEHDQRLSKYVMKLWTNFAKRGNPNDGAGKWKPFSSRADNYLNIKASGTTLKSDLKKDKVKFWENLLPEMFT